MSTSSIFAQLPTPKELRAIERRAQRDRALYLAALCKRAVGAIIRPFRGWSTRDGRAALR